MPRAYSRGQSILEHVHEGGGGRGGRGRGRGEGRGRGRGEGRGGGGGGRPAVHIDDDITTTDTNQTTRARGKTQAALSASLTDSQLLVTGHEQSLHLTRSVFNHSDREKKKKTRKRKVMNTLNNEVLHNEFLCIFSYVACTSKIPTIVRVFQARNLSV